MAKSLSHLTQTQDSKNLPGVKDIHVTTLISETSHFRSVYTKGTNLPKYGKETLTNKVRFGEGMVLVGPYLGS